MRIVLIILLIAVSFSSPAQLKRFLVQGQVIDQNNNPVSDVYIVNLSNLEKDISLRNGKFSFWVATTDSLVFSHISYHRKIVSVHKLLINPTVQLSAESVDIQEVTVTPEQQSDIDRMNENLIFLETYQQPVRARMSEEVLGPVLTIMTENNDLMRVEAASISLVRFSPSENVGRLFTKLKKKDHAYDYSHTNNQLKDVGSEKKTP